MKQNITKFIWIIVIFFGFFAVKEFIATYLLFRDLHPWLGYFFLFISLAVIFWFGVKPVYQILKLPALPGPHHGKPASDDHLRKMAKVLLVNPNIHNLEDDQWIVGLDSADTTHIRESIEKIHLQFGTKIAAKRKKVINQIFLGTALSQNGTLDSFIVLGRAMHLIKETYILYNGRPNTIGLIKVYKTCLKTMIISGGAETVTDSVTEIFMSGVGLAKEGGKGLPFIGALISSFSNGMVNAVLTTRLSMIAEAYCSKIEIESEKELTPALHGVIAMVKTMTSDVKDIIVRSYLGRMSKLKSGSGAEEDNSWTVISFIEDFYTKTKNITTNIFGKKRNNT
ncbi:MAG: DUF697 domain-containing protein [Calditrichaceae bacterium]